LASLIAPDGSVIELMDETLIGRGQPRSGDPPLVDVGLYEGGLTVSRRHARIRRVEGEWFLQVEPDARNSTLVDDHLVQIGREVRLSDQTFIRLGNVVLLFRGIPEEPEPDVTPLPAPAAPRPSGWTHRLATGVVTWAAIDRGQLKRINPFRGLMVDETIWRDAHAYHQRRAQLDLLIGHGWGIVEGLEVMAQEEGESGVVVRPGVAVDSEGHLLTVRSNTVVPVPTGQGPLYVRLRYHEEYSQPQRTWSEVDEYTRIIEGVIIDVDIAAPQGGAIELARLAHGAAIRDAANPLEPGREEIDMRFRRRVPVRPRPEIGVAQLVPEQDGAQGSPHHQLGLRLLLREITATTPYRARWLGQVTPGAPLPPASLLYLSGSGGLVMDHPLIQTLHQFLDNGGALLADACSDGSAEAFAGWVNGLSAAMRRILEPVERHHPLLSTRHIFSTAPLPGAQHSALREGDGLIFSSSDLGCLWAGGGDETPASRDDIRTSLELGVNAALYARFRQFPVEAAELDG
jgi:hypothetical protein